MQHFIVNLLVGRHPVYPTGCERIHTVRDALLWRLASLPGLDAGVTEEGKVYLFRA